MERIKSNKNKKTIRIVISLKKFFYYIIIWEHRQEKFNLSHTIGIK